MGLPFVAVVLLLKKLAAVGVYQSAKTYGFPRTYRRIIEGIRATNISREQERNIRNAIKMSFRFPITAPKQLLQSDVASFIVKNGVTILSNKNMPGFFQTIADVVSQPISSGSSFVDLVKRYHSESKTKK